MSTQYYIVLRSNAGDDDYESTTSDPYEIESVQNHDRMLHRTLSEIFHERRLTGDHKIKELLQGDTDRSSIIFKLILEREPALGDVFPKKSKLTLLWITVLCCYQDSAELLLRSGHHPRPHTHKVFTWTSALLHVLLQMYPSAWNERFVGLLIDHGADLEALDCERYTALHWAVTKGRVRTTKLLLEKGAKVNAKTDLGDTPLLALVNASISAPEAEKLVLLLLEHGADIAARDIHGRNALHQLALAPGEQVDLARVLIEKGACSSIYDNNRDQPILAAVREGKSKLVELLLDHGVSAESKNHAGEFPLHVAARYNSLTVLRTLLKRGTNIDLKTWERDLTPLHIACYRSNEESIKLLLSLGADMLDENNHGKTPMELTCYPSNMQHPEVSLANIRLTMIKALALKKDELQSSRLSKHERCIKTYYPEEWTHYQNCEAHVCKMKSTRLAESCITFFELLTKCHCQLVALMRNREFETRFKLHDLGAFSVYAEDIREAFERAQDYYQSMLDQEDVINEAVYNGLPHVVVRKIVGYIFDKCEECELKNIVQATRRLNAKNNKRTRIFY